MQPAPGLPGLHSQAGLDSFCFNTSSSLSTAGSILRPNQCLSMAVCFQIRRYAARVLHDSGPALALVLPGRRIRVETLQGLTNRLQKHHRRLNQRASASLASFWSAAAGAGFVRIDRGPRVAKRCLRAGLSRRGSRQAGPPCMLRGVWITSEPP